MSDTPWSGIIGCPACKTPITGDSVVSELLSSVADAVAVNLCCGCFSMVDSGNYEKICCCGFAGAKFDATNVSGYQCDLNWCCTSCGYMDMDHANIKYIGGCCSGCMGSHGDIGGCGCNLCCIGPQCGFYKKNIEGKNTVNAFCQWIACCIGFGCNSE